MMRLFRHSNNKRRKGFTLIECIVSFTIFAIMGTMFATFMVSSVRVVNLTLATDEDRELLLEAIAVSNKKGEYESVFHDGKVTIDTINADSGKPVTLELDLTVTDAQKGELKREFSLPVKKEGVDASEYWWTYTTSSGVKYCVFLGNDIPTIDETLDPNQGINAVSEIGEGGN